MDRSNVSIKLAIGAIIVVLLQICLGPIIAINSVMPNFIVAFTIACIVVRPDQAHLIFAFVMGLIYDLVCAGPIGAMSFTLVVCSFITSKVLFHVKSNSFIVSILAVVVTMLVIEIIYGIFMMSLVLNASFIDMLTYKVLPCVVYDVILGVIFFPIMVKVIAPPVVNANYISDINDININNSGR